MNRKIGTILLVLISPSLAFAGWKIDTRTNPERIAAGASAIIAARVSDDGKPVIQPSLKAEVSEGYECGSVVSPTTAADGTTTIVFTAAPNVENCIAKVRLTAQAPPAPDGTTPPPVTAETKVTVNPQGAAATRVGGITAIALIVLVSFAIDRLVRAFLFLMSYVSGWQRAFPDPELSEVTPSARAERNRQLVYFVLAGGLAIIAIAWLGQVRIFAALGFTNVNPLLDILVTGLILVGGAERTGQLLTGLGGAAPQAKPPSTPIEISGRLTIDDRGHKTLSAGPGNPNPKE